MADARTAAMAQGRRWRFTLLTGALLVLTGAAPALGADPATERDLALAFSLVVLGVAASSRRTALAGVLAFVWLTCTWAAPFGDGRVGEIAADAALLILILVAVESALTRALGANHVDRETIAAALSVYLLLGVGWAAGYTLIETATPGAFALAPAEAAAPWSTLLYFSFTTLTTLGYGDVLPISPLARGLANVEAIVGTFFTAVLVARLVGAYRGGADVCD